MTKMGSEAVLALERRAVDRLRRFPREPDMIVYSFRSLVALIIRGLLRVYLRFEIVGADNLPNDGESFVLVANHSSHLDTLCLLAALPLGRLHRAFPVAAEDYFFRSLPRTWFAAVAMNALPFARRMRVRESLSICAQLLAQPGNVLIIFPEGTRSRTGETQSFKAGHRGAARWPECDGAAVPSARGVSRLAKGMPDSATAEGAVDYWRGAQLRRPWHGEGARSVQSRRNCSGRWRNWGSAMEPVEQTMPSWDGTELFYRAWFPDGKQAEKALLLFHRGHEHSGRWQETVDSLGLEDVAIFAWDARGHGRSPGERGAARELTDVIRDVDTFVRQIAERYGIRAGEHDRPRA